MDTLAHIITTAPRPVETLSRSIASWRGAGFTETLTICADNVVGIPQRDDLKVLHHERLGGLKAWVWSLQYLCDTTTAPWLMIAEDDIVWTRNCKPMLMAELQAMKPKGIGYVSLYAARVVTWHLQKKNGISPLVPGYYESTLGWSTWGSQCLIVPRDAAKQLLKDAAFKTFVERHIKNKNRDAVVSKYLSQLKLRTMFRIPSLVDHIGAGNSALGNKPKKALETDYFVEAL